MKNDVIKGNALMALASIFLGLNVTAMKALLTNYLSSGQMQIYRMTFGLIIFWLVSLFIKSEKVSRKDFWGLFWAGFVGLFTMQYFYIEGLNSTSPIDASIILTIPPVIVMVYSAVFLKERMSRKKIFGVVLALAGALLIILIHSGGGMGGSMKGNLWVFLSGIGWTFYLLATTGASKRYSAITICKWLFLWGSIPCWIVYGKDFFGGRLSEHPFTLEAWGLLSYIWLFPTFITYLLTPIAMKVLTATEISMYKYIVPLVATLSAVAVGQASMRWDQPIAAVLIFLGVYFSSVSRKRGQKLPPIHMHGR